MTTTDVGAGRAAGSGDNRVLHGGPLAMAIVEGPEHIVSEVNDAFCRLVRRDRHVLLGRPFSDVDPRGEEGRECIALLDRVFSTHTSESLDDEPQSRREGAEPAYWSYSAWVAPPSEGSNAQQPLGVVVHVTDTTQAHTFRQMAALMNQELVITSVRLQEQTEAMAEADRAKDEFLAMLGHELRNPISAISNAVKLVEMQSVGHEKLEKPLRIIIRQVRHTARLVDDLLDVSRITHGKLGLRMGRVDVCEAARRCVDIAQPQMELAGCAFAVSIPAESIWMDGDPARLEQILGNLLNNAAKYTEPGGSVSLDIRRDGGEAVIVVQDSGVGIAPSMLSRIFDLFVQEDRSLSRSRGGLGIGLSLVRTLVEMHGGRVTAASEGLGKGSTFTVRLPASVERGAAAPSGVRPAGAGSPSRRILVVDDNIDAAQTLGDILETWGHEVRLAHDGVLAMEAMHREPPDVVLLDIGLPRMDGFEVARSVRATEGLERIRLVAMTGYGSETDRQATLEAGFDVHLVKPIDLDYLHGVLSEYAER